MSISFRFTSHGKLFLPARMGKYPTFLFGRSLGNRARARPWVMILSLQGHPFGQFLFTSPLFLFIPIPHPPGPGVQPPPYLLREEGEG